MITTLASLLFNLWTVGVIVIGFFSIAIHLCVKLAIRDRRMAGVKQATKTARASESVRWPEPDTSGDRPSLIIGTDPIGSRDFDGKVIFYGPNGPVDLSGFLRGVQLSPDTLEAVNDSTARGTHDREAPDRPEHEGDQDRASAIRDTLDRLDGDEPLRADRSGGDEPARAERTDHRGDPFDGADPIVFGRAGVGASGGSDQP